LCWFRSHTAKEIKWGGAKHHPEDKDDGQRMHPRSSFKAFLEVVKSRSLPWENAEMDAIHSLQLILRDSFRDVAEGTSNSKAIVNGQVQLGELELRGINELSSVAREMVRLIETATVPIFAVDTDGCINGWNAKIAELTGLSVEEAMGKSLVNDLIFKESEEIVEKLLSRALRGISHLSFLYNRSFFCIMFAGIAHCSQGKELYLLMYIKSQKCIHMIYTYLLGEVSKYMIYILRCTQFHRLLSFIGLLLFFCVYSMNKYRKWGPARNYH
jgi:PAS domain-containing protein